MSNRDYPFIQQLADKDHAFARYLFDSIDAVHPSLGIKCSKICKMVASPNFWKLEKSNLKRRKKIFSKISRFEQDALVSLLKYKRELSRKKRITSMANENAQVLNHPFLKWAGGKLRVLNHIQQHFPFKISGRYIEPFVGAGSVALNTIADETIINDFNKDLILLWTSIRDNPTKLLNECKKLFVEKNMGEDEYYALRDEFNNSATGIRRAALFVYLNRHCFNGLCRYSKTGKFNTPIGKYKTVYFPETEILKASEISQKWKIVNKDFRDVMTEARSGDVVYCDPPYVPVSLTSYFTSYSPNEFNWSDQVDLAVAASSAASRGALVLISNHLTPETEELYKKYGAEIKIIEVSRHISATTANRKKIRELIAVFNPK